MRETWVRSLGWKDPLEKEMATHSSILAWRIPWMEKPGGLQSTGSQRVRHDWATSLSQSYNHVSVSHSVVPNSLWPHGLQPSVHEIFQVIILEWVTISFSNAWKWKVKVKSLSRVQLFVTPWTAAPQAPPSMGFSRQEYWRRVPWRILSITLLACNMSAVVQ